MGHFVIPMFSQTPLARREPRQKTRPLYNNAASSCKSQGPHSKPWGPTQTEETNDALGGCTETSHIRAGRGTQNVGILRTSLLLSSLKVSLLTCVSQWAALGSDDTQPIKANQEGMIQPPHCTQEEAGAKTCYGHRAGWGGAETGPHSCPLLWRPVPGEPGPPFTHLRVPGETPHPHS